MQTSEIVFLIILDSKNNLAQQITFFFKTINHAKLQITNILQTLEKNI